MGRAVKSSQEATSTIQSQKIWEVPIQPAVLPSEKLLSGDTAPLQPSRDTVRAWLATVIAPISTALRTEIQQLRWAWSFRCGSQGFEYLWPIQVMVPTAYHPNLVQFFRHNPELKANADRHDQVMAALLGAYREAFDRLFWNEEFVQLASNVEKASHDRAYLAEYVVNGIRDLESRYGFADVWRVKGSAFLALRDLSPLRDSFAELERRRVAFAPEPAALLGQFERVQQELADAFQLPPIAL